MISRRVYLRLVRSGQLLGCSLLLLGKMDIIEFGTRLPILEAFLVSHRNHILKQQESPKMVVMTAFLGSIVNAFRGSDFIYDEIPKCPAMR